MNRQSRKKTAHTSLVTLSPIEYRHDDPEARLRTVSDALEAEVLKAQDGLDTQVLRQCPMVHMARLQIIDNVIPEMGQLPPDCLKCTYLLFVAEVDGDVDDFFDALYNGPQYPFDWAKEAESRARHADFVHKVWGQCIGYPDDPGCVFFRQYMDRCSIKVRLPFAAYNYTVAEINEARELQKNFAHFAETSQGLGPEELFDKWQDFVAQYDPFESSGHLSIKKHSRRANDKSTSTDELIHPHLFSSSHDEHPDDREHR